LFALPPCSRVSGGLEQRSSADACAVKAMQRSYCASYGRDCSSDIGLLIVCGSFVSQFKLAMAYVGEIGRNSHAATASDRVTQQVNPTAPTGAETLDSAPWRDQNDRHLDSRLQYANSASPTPRPSRGRGSGATSYRGPPAWVARLLSVDHVSRAAAGADAPARVPWYSFYTWRTVADSGAPAFRASELPWHRGLTGCRNGGSAIDHEVSSPADGRFANAVAIL